MVRKVQSLISPFKNRKFPFLPQPQPPLRLSLRGLLIVPFVLQISITVGLVSYWSFRNGQQAVNSLVMNLQEQTVQRINQHLDSYLSNTRKLNELNAQAINSGLIDPRNQDQLGRFFWQQAKLYKVGYILFGSTTGDYVDVGRPQTYPVEFVTERISRQRYGNQSLYSYEPDQSGSRKRLISTLSHYPFQKEAWYREVMQTQMTRWTSVYTWETISANPLAIAISSPLYDQERNLIGAIAIEQRLCQISDFLRQLKVTPGAKIVILERTGEIIANSSPTKPYQVVDQKPRRLKAVDSDDPVIQSTSRLLLQQFGDFQKIRDRQHLNIWVNHERQFVQITPWQDQFGLDWLMVLVIPERDFMGLINHNTRQTVLFCIAAFITSILIGILIAQKISRAILKVDELAKSITGGNLDQSLERQRIDELDRLSQSFNQMAQQLKQSFEELEKTNQELEARVEERTHKLKHINQELHRLSHLDGLTHIANRRHFDEYLTQQWKYCGQEQQALSLILGDVDFFKNYNDFYGHQRGDNCLQQVAQILERTVQQSKALVARYGGEEFAIILPTTDALESITIAKLIQQAIHQSQLIHGNSEVSAYVTISLGIATLVPTLLDSPNSLVTAADQALYEAKRRGRNQAIHGLYLSD